MFRTVVLLKDQVRARDDPQLGALLDRVRNGRQTQQDLDLLNANIIGRSQVTFHDGLRAITPLNRTRWALNMEAVVGWARFNKRHISIFVSTHTWRNGTLSQSIVAQTIGQGDDSTWENVRGSALELRGNRVANGEPSKCDFTSLYVQLSRCTTLQGIKLLSPVRHQDFIGNSLDQAMAGGMQRLKYLAAETRRVYEDQDVEKQW
ncbi:hypothetical protein HIM_11228 [Hirsutella minnesotensis 3608]|uniref:Uncharacterized protein n=1 Tax=Hirsutella minnesotensis 3608 TaxID=1043627 RepID=A0A0F8A1F7_9HYPO|nr:hypothetical protein HIM_11228 [Hirsutella minnesotensis 3608]